MVIDRLSDYFTGLKINSITLDEFKQTFEELYNSTYKSQYPTLDDLVSTVSPSYIVRTVIEHHCTVNNIPNPILSKQDNSHLKHHPFFKNRKYVCAAPFTTLRFGLNGKMTVCCINTTYDLGTVPTTSPEQAWFGDKIQKLRESLSNYNFSLGCLECTNHIDVGNIHNSILAQQDRALPDIEEVVKRRYPSQLIFQIHNTCNYECIMCSGVFSSSIRKNRDKQPVTGNVYGDEFVKQITPFLKEAKKVEFLGGEPFLISTNFKLLEVIRQVNPNLKIDIISNGSVFNDKIKNILTQLPNASVHISLDSLIPYIYAYIRRNGNLQNVLSNIEEFIKIDKLKSVSICPMIQNVLEIPNFVTFCVERKLGLYINNVEDIISGSSTRYKGLYENSTIENKNCNSYTEQPIREFRLWTLPIEEKQKIKDKLLSHNYPQEYQSCINSFINFLMNYIP